MKKNVLTMKRLLDGVMMATKYHLKATYNTVQYTGVSSCDTIFDTFGTKGFINSERGLYVFQHNKSDKKGNNFAEKGCWLVGNPGDIVIVSDEAFKRDYEVGEG